MKLIIGLGNPGDSYKLTRHNYGWLVVDQILKENNLSLDVKKFNGKFSKTVINDQKVIIAKPTTFMNNSGDFVQKIINYFKVDLNNVLVIHDDIDMDFGKHKLKFGGGSGGHNGIKDITNMLGKESYTRLKVGINSMLNKNTRTFVLKEFSKAEKDKLEVLLKKYRIISEDFLINNFKDLTNKHNEK